MKKLQKECGVTRISLENLALLAPLHGPVRFIMHYAPSGTTVEDKTLVVFQDGYRHTATGFACGYGGEGPHGLLTAIQTYLKREDITIEHICGWRGREYLILPGVGNGELILLFSSANCEVW